MSPRRPSPSLSVPSERGAPCAAEAEHPPESTFRRPRAGSGSRGEVGLTCKPPLPDIPPQQVPSFGGRVPQLLTQRPPELRFDRAALAAHPRRLRMLPRAAPLSAAGGSPRRGRAAAATWGRGAEPPRCSWRHRRSVRAAPSPERRPPRPRGSGVAVSFSVPSRVRRLVARFPPSLPRNLVLRSGKAAPGSGPAPAPRARRVVGPAPEPGSPSSACRASDGKWPPAPSGLAGTPRPSV